MLYFYLSEIVSEKTNCFHLHYDMIYDDPTIPFDS